MVKPNFYIFVSREKNMEICFKHMIYGTDIKLPDHRALCNVKEGDFIFLYDMDKRELYGPFIAESRMFRDTTDLGWSGKWPYRVPIKPWSFFVGVIDKYGLQRVYSKIKKDLITLRDLDDLHRQYLNPLLWSEGLALFEAFLEEAEFKRPEEISKLFGSRPIRKSPLKSRPLPKTPSEYQVELYLLQNYERLEELVGCNFEEVYNQLYLYQNRFLDILTVHKYGERVLKATVIEIKTDCKKDSIEKGLEELGHYMYTITEWPTRSTKKVYGVLLTPKSKSPLEDLWESKKDEISKLYGLDDRKLKWIQYEVKDGDLVFC